MPPVEAKVANAIATEGFSEHEIPDEPLLRRLDVIIKIAVRALAILMTVVIVFGVIDVMYLIYEFLRTPPYFVLRMSDILELFGAFLGVLIAIEIFVNITVYLRKDVIHVNIVLATALMAIARKVIILDFSQIDASYVFAVAAVVLSMSIGYWLIAVQGIQTIKIPRPASAKTKNQGQTPSA